LSEGGILPINSETLVLNALGIIADKLEEAAREIRRLLEPQDWIPIEYRGNLLGRIRQVESRTEFIPVESLRIRSDDPAITKFLVPKVLDQSKEKHGWNYRVFDKDGVLDRIVVYAAWKPEEIEDLKGPFGWAFQKAAERAKKKKEKDQK